MEDCEFVESISGESGGLAQTVKSCGVLNGSITKFFDALFTPDEVDSFDASCNTCKHFKRSPMSKEEKSERNVFGMPGHCEKKNISTVGWQRGQYYGFDNEHCYENRRTGMRPKDACKLEVRL